jgi:hypothetical protein
MFVQDVKNVHQRNTYMKPFFIFNYEKMNIFEKYFNCLQTNFSILNLNVFERYQLRR